MGSWLVCRGMGCIDRRGKGVVIAFLDFGEFRERGVYFLHGCFCNLCCERDRCLWGKGGGERGGGLDLLYVILDLSNGV